MESSRGVRTQEFQSLCKSSEFCSACGLMPHLFKKKVKISTYKPSVSKFHVFTSELLTSLYGTHRRRQIKYPIEMIFFLLLIASRISVFVLWQTVTLMVFCLKPKMVYFISQTYIQMIISDLFCMSA